VYDRTTSVNLIPASIKQLASTMKLDLPVSVVISSQVAIYVRIVSNKTLLTVDEIHFTCGR